MVIVKDKITTEELRKMSEKMFGNLVKGMVDVKKEIMAVDGELHSDILEFLLSQEGSEPKDVWGINIYPDKTGQDFIEFDSVMNLKPSFGNKTRGVEDEGLRNKIIEIVNKLVAK